ncbi:MAG: type II and III secretion system protein family protein [Alphaproteobacteria bacterium]|nr:type II and III secretion system protein family protein [Alphaproteobacteria bacterium]MBP7759588.1 type II and III secretion system protein family protein [Alphaproteobacteria bacterium]MBP7763127.1 type II and III secretion system protein family protein [Alphaproteobacteria bacterium]MBP7904586.1 type II and III secretion system protein family protein [Alphaproteobacteria bacterium]
MNGFCSRLRSVFALSFLALTFVAGTGGWTSSYADKGDLQPIYSAPKTHAPTDIPLGKAEVVLLDGDVSDILVANPAIVDVQAIQSNRLYIVGLAVGDTNIIALDGSGNVLRKLDVHVAYDLQAIQSLVDRLFPDENAKVGSIHDQIYLTGTVSTPEAASKIANLVGHYVSDLQDEDKATDQLISNMLEVRGEQQVMLQVKIVEATRSVLKELGVNTNANDPNELSAVRLFDRTPPSQFIDGTDALQFGGADGLSLSQDAIGAAGLLFDSGLKGIGEIGIFLDALEEQNLVNVLAEPNLTAVSGQQAGFLAGGEFPVPTGRDQFGNITIEFREFGVSLNFKPVVMSDKRISLQMNTEVSSLDSTNAVVLADLVVPGLDIRRAETTIEIPSGGSLMIAGLLQSEAAKGLSGLPGIKDTPVLGKLVSSDSFRRDETELVVIVTGYLVESYADKEKAVSLSKGQQGPLAEVFARNMRRKYNFEDESVFTASGNYGYMLD